MNWKPIPINVDYEISDTGVVRRRLPGWGSRVGKILSIRKRDGAYLRVKLSKNGRDTVHMVHVLVCLAFHGPSPTGRPYACHKNDNAHDNRASNLYWGSSEDNFRDKVRNGRHTVRGVTHPRAILNEKKALYLRRMKGVVSERKLARELGISRSAVCQVQRGVTWKTRKAGYEASTRH